MPPTLTMPRNRLVLGLLLAATILFGLGVRKYGVQLPYHFSKSAGDALWTVAVYLTLAVAFPRCLPWKLGAISLAISYLDEFGQLIQVPWLDALRATLPGKLLLGAVFDWWDMLRYTAGAAIAFACDSISESMRTTEKPAG